MSEGRGMGRAEREGEEGARMGEKFLFAGADFDGAVSLLGIQQIPPCGMGVYLLYWVV